MGRCDACAEAPSRRGCRTRRSAMLAAAKVTHLQYGKMFRWNNGGKDSECNQNNSPLSTTEEKLCTFAIENINTFTSKL